MNIHQYRVYLVFKALQEDYPNFKKMTEPKIPFDSLKLIFSTISGLGTSSAHDFAEYAELHGIIRKYGKEYLFYKEKLETYCVQISEIDKKELEKEYKNMAKKIKENFA